MIEMDYNFATDKHSGQNVSILVAKDNIHEAFFAAQVRWKGGQDEYVVRSRLNWIDRLGLVKVEVKTDSELAIMDLANQIQKKCSSTTVISKQTPKGSKGARGMGERARLAVQGQMRAVKAATEKNYKTAIVGEEHILIPWITRHAAWTLSRFLVQSSGHTAYYNMRGKNYNIGALPFGEVCLHGDHAVDGDKWG